MTFFTIRLVATLGTPDGEVLPCCGGLLRSVRAVHWFSTRDNYDTSVSGNPVTNSTIPE